jgi:transcriptional regulator with XRE-family HTH domain
MTTKKKRVRPQLSAEELSMARSMHDRYKAIGVSQEELAERLGITQGGFGHWVNGRERVPAKKAQTLAAALGMRPEEVSVAYREANRPLDRISDDILALRFAVLGLAVTLSERRLVEDGAFETRIREFAKEFPKFLEGPGWLGVLLGQIEAARGTAAKADARAPKRRVASSAGRKP